MRTKIVVKCTAKKETLSYRSDNPVATAISLEIPFDANSIYWQLSGGTAINLNTTNQAAADIFKLGESYECYIGPPQSIDFAKEIDQYLKDQNIDPTSNLVWTHLTEFVKQIKPKL